MKLKSVFVVLSVAILSGMASFGFAENNAAEDVKNATVDATKNTVNATTDATEKTVEAGMSATSNVIAAVIPGEQTTPTPEEKK